MWLLSRHFCFSQVDSLETFNNKTSASFRCDLHSDCPPAEKTTPSFSTDYVIYCAQSNWPIYAKTSVSNAGYLFNVSSRCPKSLFHRLWGADMRFPHHRILAKLLRISDSSGSPRQLLFFSMRIGQRLCWPRPSFGKDKRLSEGPDRPENERPG